MAWRILISTQPIISSWQLVRVALLKPFEFRSLNLHANYQYFISETIFHPTKFCVFDRMKFNKKIMEKVINRLSSSIPIRLDELSSIWIRNQDGWICGFKLCRCARVPFVLENEKRTLLNVLNKKRSTVSLQTYLLSLSLSFFCSCCCCNINKECSGLHARDLFPY